MSLLGQHLCKSSFFVEQHPHDSESFVEQHPRDSVSSGPPQELPVPNLGHNVTHWSHPCTPGIPDVAAAQPPGSVQVHPSMSPNPPGQLPCHQPGCPDHSCKTQPRSRSPPWTPLFRPCILGSDCHLLGRTRDRPGEMQEVKVEVSKAQLSNKVQTFTGAGINEWISSYK